MQSDGYHCVVIGGNGASGREVIRNFSQHEHCSKITVIARNALEEWENDSKIKAKLNLIKIESLDTISNLKQQLSQEKIDTFFCCLGTQVKQGKEIFEKVDYKYCVDFAKLGKELNVPHFSLVSSEGASKDSCFLYMKTKARTEEAIKAMNFEYFSIFQPGF